MLGIIVYGVIMLFFGVLLGESATKKKINELGIILKDEKHLDDGSGHVVIRSTKHGPNYVGMLPADVFEIHTNGNGILQYFVIVPDEK